jgi:hypothetical protein
MHKPRWLFLGIGSVGLCASGMAGLLLFLHGLAPQPGVTRANFDRLQLGMKTEEVEAILGGPPDSCTIDNPPARGYMSAGSWHGRGFTIGVDFHWDGRVTEKYLQEEDGTFLGKLRSWLGW